MGIFSRQKGSGELALVFDIGSSSVGGALFEIKKGGIPKIIGVFREPIIFEEKLDTEKFLSLTLKALDTVASKIYSANIGKPAKVFCVLSSPFYASATRTIKLERNAPFIFTTKLADDLIEKEIVLFEEEHGVKSLDINSKVRSIELRNMKTSLNGYMVADPINKKAKMLEMVVFISMSGDQILKKIEETVFRHFHLKEIKFSSFAMASFAVARDMFVKQDNFLLVDIAGEVTDISMIRKDILSSSISFPLGRNFMIRRVAETLGCSLSEAKSFISLYKDGHAEKSVEEKLEPIISKLKAEWLKGFQESLVKLSDNISVPSTIFITVDQELADFFGEIIRTEQFSQYTFTESEFKIIFLNKENLHGTAAFQDEVTRDPFLIIESIYINRFIW